MGVEERALEAVVVSMDGRLVMWGLVVSWGVGFKWRVTQSREFELSLVSVVRRELLVTLAVLLFRAVV